MYRSLKANITILQEVPVPLLRCKKIGMHMLVDLLEKHKQTTRHYREIYMRLRRRDLELSKISGDTEFSLYGRQ